jgi:hypothetical protein
MDRGECGDKAAPLAPDAMQEAAFVLAPALMVVFGGSSGSSGSGLLNYTWLWDVSTSTWTEVRVSSVICLWWPCARAPQLMCCCKFSYYTSCAQSVDSIVAGLLGQSCARSFSAAATYYLNSVQSNCVLRCCRHFVAVLTLPLQLMRCFHARHLNSVQSVCVHPKRSCAPLLQAFCGSPAPCPRTSCAAAT